MALITYGTSTAATITIASLANGSGRCSTAIDNTSTAFLSADIGVKVKSAAASTSATGYVSVYLVRSYDGTSYDDAFGGTDAAFTPVNATLLGTVNVVANSTTYYKVFETSELGITLPKKWAIALVNSSGATLDGTGGSHEVIYTGKY
jgi:hypothetical protein